jgi:hypothetical protein
MNKFIVDIQPAPTQPKLVYQSQQFPNFNKSSNVLIQCSDPEQRLAIISSIVSDIIFDFVPAKENIIILDYTNYGELDPFKDAATFITNEEESIGLLQRIRFAENNEKQFIIIHELDNFALFQPGGKITNAIRSIRKCMPNTHIVASMSSTDLDLISEELQSYFPTKIQMFENPRSEEVSV